MGDSEFDSFFDDTPAPAPAAEEADPFADGAPAMAAPAPDMGDMGGMDMGGMGDGGMSNDMADMSSAFVTTANLSDSGPLAEWRAANRTKMEERAAASKAELDKILAQAEADRTAFYEQRTQTIESAKKSNREQEAALKETLDGQSTKDNLWESVVELVDLQAQKDSADITRMRQTMLAMKNE
jgi:hypothetical protein